MTQPTRGGSVLAQVLVLLGAVLALEVPGCGGIVTSGTGGSGGASSDGGDVTEAPPDVSTGGNDGSTGGKKGGARRCGNGQRDPGEECDGQDFGPETCASATSGARPMGQLRCTSACALDTSYCGSSVPPSNTGGRSGAGGTFGAGGASGTTPEEGCYRQGGVPNPSDKTQCGYGSTASAYCYQYYAKNVTSAPPSAPGCGATCGCDALPSAYAHCVSNLGCAWILGCAMQTHCMSVGECYGTPCARLLDDAGGPDSATALLFDTTIATMARTGCGVCN